MYIIETDENSSQLHLVECKNKHKYITNITCLSTKSKTCIPVSILILVTGDLPIGDW